jgi:hypothetical protein
LFAVAAAEQLVHNELVKATLEVINQMQADGVICHYGIGGGVAAAYYTEPASTPDMEAFVILPFDPRGESASMSALHSYLAARGCSCNGQHFEIRGWPVRISAARNDLEHAAVAGSLPESVDGEAAWILAAEDLIAIALAESSLRGQIWIQRLTEADAFDELTLKAVLTSNGLISKWEEFEKKYPPQFASKEGTERARASFTEKVKILEKLRERDKAIAASGLRRQPLGADCDKTRQGSK